MNSKVKCTCGWSWNKSDSSKKDMYVCHNCGKDNTMKDGGWLSKYDAPEAQNGIEGTMGGLTDKGFDYNGAWGGPSMQMGGSIPGTVGFSYARTQSPAPSKGKYAKKTMASAQNGQEMKFYQEGLDWTPKTISRDGSFITEAQTGKKLKYDLDKPVSAKQDATKVVPQKTMSKEQAAKFKAKKDAEELQRRKTAIATSKAAKNKPLSIQNIADESGAIGDKFRIFPDDPNSIIDEYVNPGVMIGNMASSLGRLPLNVQEGNYGQAAMSIATPLAAGALAGIGSKSTGQFVNNLVNPLAGTEGILKTPTSSLSNLDDKMPQSLNDLFNTGFKKDPLYHYPAFVKKRKDVVESISSPEGRKRLQGYIDNSRHLQRQGKNVDNMIENFKNSKFEVASPEWDFIKKEWRKDAEGNTAMFDVDPNNAYAWYRGGFDNPAYVSMGQNYTPYDASHILEHEFAHVFQSGDEINTVDNTLANISLKPANPTQSFFEFVNEINPFNKKKDAGISVTKDIYGSGYDSLQRNADYWRTGAGRGQEKAAFAAEVRENLLQRGLIKDRYDDITPKILQEHYNLYKNTKGDKYNLRLYDIMNKDKKNFGYLSEALNRMPALVPAGVATAGVASQLPEQKNGGWLSKYN